MYIHHHYTTEKNGYDSKTRSVYVFKIQEKSRCRYSFVFKVLILLKKKNSKEKTYFLLGVALCFTIMVYYTCIIQDICSQRWWIYEKLYDFSCQFCWNLLVLLVRYILFFVFVCALPFLAVFSLLPLYTLIGKSFFFCLIPAVITRRSKNYSGLLVNRERDL